MRKILLVFLVVLSFMAVSCQSQDKTPEDEGPGPFGLKMGMTYDELKEIDPNIKLFMEGENYIYEMTKVPLPHPDYKYFTVVVAPKSGLSMIIAISKVINCAPDGKQLQEKFREHSTMLEEVYGTCKKDDYLEEGSALKEPEDFMKSLQKEERVLSYTWAKEYGSKLTNDIESIQLKTDAYYQNVGILSLTYKFSNFKQYNQEKEDIKRAAF